ncbi:hypothetical protein B0T17DRAFT_307668 [Bombardia bombarda]|uniref:Uncharacterized protein n=1 Tax=Bombardia bombarda TaxID=252184 RepID=A0AA39WUS2_9PEZI|nr:hypothetical protein B0T17DRAFT_307668 [Bombardia bombarda]
MSQSREKKTRQHKPKQNKPGERPVITTTRPLASWIPAGTGRRQDMIVRFLINLSCMAACCVVHLGATPKKQRRLQKGNTRPSDQSGIAFIPQCLARMAICNLRDGPSVGLEPASRYCYLSWPYMVYHIHVAQDATRQDRPFMLKVRNYLPASVLQLLVLRPGELLSLLPYPSLLCSIITRVISPTITAYGMVCSFTMSNGLRDLHVGLLCSLSAVWLPFTSGFAVAAYLGSDLWYRNQFFQKFRLRTLVILTSDKQAEALWVHKGKMPRPFCSSPTEHH